MSQVRETIHDQSKPWMCLALPKETKPCNFPALLLRGALLILLIASLSSVAFFSPQSRWWPDSFESAGPGDNDSESGDPEVVEEIRNGDESEPTPTNISQIVFGLGGSVSTWPSRRWYTELWWRPNLTRGFVWLDGEPGASGISWPETAPPYRVSEDRIRFKHSAPPSSVRIARILLETFRLGLPAVRWFVMGDDDTVFFPDNLATVLARYDHRQMYYVGGSSESVEQDELHSYDMAFGGGGFAVSYPLAAALAGTLDGCIDRYRSFYGSDERVWACVSELGVPLTRERGFHQVDVRGDVFGLLAAHPVAPLVSLHHLDYVAPLFPNRTRLDSLAALFHAYRLDPPRVVQHSFCSHPRRRLTLSVSWGYAALLYPSPAVAPKDLERPLLTFRTWRSRGNGPFLFNTRPLHPEPCRRPIVFFLDAAADMGNASSLTTYRRTEEEGRRCGRRTYSGVMGVEEIAASAANMDPGDWKRAPRRQCCKIWDRGPRNSVLRVSIRRCRRQERVVNEG